MKEGLSTRHKKKNSKHQQNQKAPIYFLGPRCTPRKCASTCIGLNSLHPQWSPLRRNRRTILKLKSDIVNPAYFKKHDCHVVNQVTSTLAFLRSSITASRYLHELLQRNELCKKTSCSPVQNCFVLSLSWSLLFNCRNLS